jgi:ubiquinone/menaquinone biosynthesis C-methylase UbiE
MEIKAAAASERRRAGAYGFDAPYAIIGLLAGAVTCIVIAALWASGVPILYGPLWLGLYGLILLAAATSFLYTTRRGKFIVWRELIEALALTGNEATLDLGCGRGLVLLEVARHLANSRAVGLDLWRSRDQSGNAEETTLANARAEGMRERIELATGDMAKLPFDDASFDLVTSSLAIHNIPSATGRIKAIDEAARVLRPGGRLLIADFRHGRAYAARLHALGLQNVVRRSLGWRFWYGGPPWATYLVSAVNRQQDT